MSEELRRRLKALGADDTKIAALAEMFSDAQLTRLLDQVERGDYTAKAQRIAYKSTAAAHEGARFEDAAADYFAFDGRL